MCFIPTAVGFSKYIKISTESTCKFVPLLEFGKIGFPTKLDGFFLIISTLNQRCDIIQACALKNEMNAFNVGTEIHCLFFVADMIALFVTKIFGIVKWIRDDYFIKAKRN